MCTSWTITSIQLWSIQMLLSVHSAEAIKVQVIVCFAVVLVFFSFISSQTIFHFIICSYFVAGRWMTLDKITSLPWHSFWHFAVSVEYFWAHLQSVHSWAVPLLWYPFHSKVYASGSQKIGHDPNVGRQMKSVGSRTTVWVTWVAIDF